MDPADKSSQPGSSASIVRDALRYWEQGRAAYNLVLAAVVLVWLIWTWPHFRPAMTLDSLFKLLILAVIANLPYCLVYVLDIPLQHSSGRGLWVRRRWILWLVGTLIALLVTCYWIADEIYPYVG